MVNYQVCIARFISISIFVLNKTVNKKKPINSTNKIEHVLFYTIYLLHIKSMN